MWESFPIRNQKVPIRKTRRFLAPPASNHPAQEMPANGFTGKAVPRGQSCWNKALKRATTLHCAGGKIVLRCF